VNYNDPHTRTSTEKRREPKILINTPSGDEESSSSGIAIVKKIRFIEKASQALKKKS